MTNTNHCSCCICKRNNEYNNLISVEAQIDFLNSLTTIDKLRVIVYESSFTHVDELIEMQNISKVIDMKKLLYFIKASFQMIDCDELHFFADVSDTHITELCALYAKYVMFQINMLDDYFDAHDDEQKESNFKILSYMLDTHAVFILENILQSDEQKHNFVNVLINCYFIYKDEFHKYVSNETIKKFIEFHN